VVAVVVVVVVVVAALYVGGVGPFSGSTTSGSGGSAQTYSEALKTAENAASPYGSGTWSSLLAVGFDLPSAFALPANFSMPGLGSAGCTGTATAGGLTSVTLPAFSGDLGSGQAPAWLFFLVGSSTLAIVSVSAGAATVWEKFSGVGCAAFGLLGGSSSGVVDSSTAVSAVMNAGGSEFVQQHPGGMLAMALTPAILGIGGNWSIAYTTCPENGHALAGTTYYEMDANVSSSTGRLVGSLNSGPTSCAGVNLTGLFSLGGGTGGGPTPLGAAVGFGGVIETSSTSGTENGFNCTTTAPCSTYDVPISSASDGITWGDVFLNVTDPFGASLTPGTTVTGMSYTVRSISGSVVCQTVSPMEFGWTTGSGANPILTSQTLVLTVQAGAPNPLLGGGYALNAIGFGAFSGTVHVSIP
jgi:hypothetical protein